MMLESSKGRVMPSNANRDGRERFRARLLDPISVSFRRDWDPRPGGQAVSSSEKQAIRDRLARELTAVTPIHRGLS
jgi:hypothetical protein